MSAVQLGRFVGKGRSTMNLSLDPEMGKLIQERLNSGTYSTPEDVVAAALHALEQQETIGEFEPGELDRLLAEGERSIEREGTIDGEDAFRGRSERRSTATNLPT